MTEVKVMVQAKKPYMSPLISELGNLRAITKNVGKTGANDPGSGNTSKTR